MFTRIAAVCTVCLLVATSPMTQAEDAYPDQKALAATVEKGYEYLKAKQGADGTWLPRVGPGVTALTISALVKAGKSPDDPVIAKALDAVLKNVKDDGGVYNRGLETYTTALAIVALSDCNKDGKYDKVIAAAAKYLRSVQDTQGDDSSKLGYGGAGYGKGVGRPDTSNTAFFVEALIASGAKTDDPAVKKALTFLSRAQNLPGEFNDQPFAKKADDDNKGGIVYEPSSQDDERSPKRTPAGGLRSEGGMTYAGLKSFLYAGLGKDDPRVKAALDWIARHYTLDENPGQKKAGLFYYYHTFAKAMGALGVDEFEDAAGKKHAWRVELYTKLSGTQAKDGSWVNDDRNFMEDQPELCTAFALLALSYTKQPTK